MSFRVWFLRMVWIVAAAVALSGCPDDEKTEEEKPGEDGLAIAIDPAAPKAEEKVTITVTVTGEIEGKVNIAVDNCGEGDALMAATDHDVTDSKATAEVTPAAATAADKMCKITATAKIGGEDMSKEHEFAVAEAGAPASNLQGYTLAIADPSADNQVVAFPVKVTATESATSGDTKIAADSVEVTIEKACSADGMAPADADWVAHGSFSGKLMAKATDDSGTHHFDVTIANVDVVGAETNKPDCHIRACADVMLNDDGDALVNGCSVVPTQVTGN